MVSSSPVDTMLDLLEVEELDSNLYRGRNEDNGEWPTLFGGQVAAQALMAASRTVPAGRHPHSLHGYFLRPGRPDHPVILQVSRDRDGRSFSARHVVAVQHNKVIFSMSASFQVAEAGIDVVSVHPTLSPGPEELPEGLLIPEFKPLLRFRPFPLRVSAEGMAFPIPQRLWARSAVDLPDDPIYHAGALTYLSDIGSGFSESKVPGLPAGGPSLDHSVWFHAPLRLDDWVLLEMAPLKVGGSRGVYGATIVDRVGTLGAMLAQEVLLRPPPDS
jgi:acyl-CoA thioesterase-2